MSEAAAFKGTFSDFRIVKGRKVVQILVEVPSELANAALVALGGIPDPANPVWVAVARLDAKPAEQKQLPSPDKKRWDDLPPAQQAAIRCGEADFRRFLDEEICTIQGWDAPSNADEAAQVIRHFCGINSRAELNDNTKAAGTWRRLDTDFWAWQRGIRQ